MKTKIVISIIALALTFIIGYILGKSYQKGEEGKERIVEKIECVSYPEYIHDTIYPKPVIEYYTRYVNVTDIDTASIIADYLLTRKYHLDFSTDSLGVFMVDAEVADNELISAVSTIRPITQVRTIEKEIQSYKIQTLQFFVMGGTSVDLSAQKLQVGADFKQKVMFGVSGMRMNDKYNYTIDLGIKF